MNDTQTWLEALKDGVLNGWSLIVTNAPSLLLGLIILVIGWFAGRLVRAAVRRLTDTANALLDRFFRRGVLSGARLSSGAMAVLGELAFWLTILFAATMALRTAGLTSMADWLGEASGYIPNLLVGTAIITLGYVLSRLAGEQVAAQSGASKAGQNKLIGKISQAAIFTTALVIGLDQIGVDVTFLVTLFAVSVGAIFSGLSIAFALGARDHVRNLIGSRTAQREIVIGQLVRIGSISGSLLEITRTHIILDTDEGKTLVPGNVVDRENIILIAPELDIETADGPDNV